MCRHGHARTITGSRSAAAVTLFWFPIAEGLKRSFLLTRPDNVSDLEKPALHLCWTAVRQAGLSLENGPLIAAGKLLFLFGNNGASLSRWAKHKANRLKRFKAFTFGLPHTNCRGQTVAPVLCCVVLSLEKVRACRIGFALFVRDTTKGHAFVVDFLTIRPAVIAAPFHL